MVGSSKSAGAGAFSAPNAIPKARAPPLKSYSNGVPLSLAEPIGALGLTKLSVVSILGVAESDVDEDISALILKLSPWCSPPSRNILLLVLRELVSLDKRKLPSGPSD